VVDLSGTVPRPVARGLVRFRDGLCPRLGAHLEEAVRANLEHYAEVARSGGAARRPRFKPGGIYVHTPGPWFETPAEDHTYRRLGYDVVGKTAGPEFRLARMYRMCLAMVSIVVNPAEGLGDFEIADLRAIYRRCGPAVARIVLDAIAAAAAGERRCRCGQPGEASLFGEFARFARHQGAPHDD